MALRLSQKDLAALMRGETPETKDSGRHAARATGKKDDAVQTLVWQCQVDRLPPPTPEFRFHATRRWKFDLAWPDLMLAVEIEGVIYPRKTDDDRTVLRGRHVSPAGFREDCVKYGEAFAAGWTVLRVLPEQVTDGSALRWLQRRFNGAVDAALDDLACRPVKTATTRPPGRRLP